MGKTLRALLLVTDVGFLLYWTITLGRVLPAAWLFAGYEDPVVSAWNLSFMPLDLLVSATGIGAVVLARRCPGSARALLTISLGATSISGLQAIAFWTLRREVDLAWWLPNLFLLLWPLPFLARIVWAGEGPRAGDVSAASAR